MAKYYKEAIIKTRSWETRELVPQQINYKGKREMERKPTNYKAFEPTAMRGPNLDPDSNKLLKKKPKTYDIYETVGN